MKKYILIPALVLLSTVGFSQTSDSIASKKIALGAFFSPDYCYRILKPDEASKPVTEIRDTLEIPKFGYSTGVTFAYSLTRRLVVEVGVLYADKGEQTKNYLTGNSFSGSFPVKNKLINHYHYLDIPVKANYNLTKGKTKLFLTAGISTNFFLNQQTVSTLEYSVKQSEQNSSTVTSDFSKTNFAVIAGIGVKLPLSEKAFISFTPIYKRSIHSVIKAPIKTYLYSLGLNIILSFEL